MKKPPNAPRPSDGLGPPEREFWDQVTGGWQLDEAALAVLSIACRALQRSREAREVIERTGATVTDRFGQAKVSPAILIERDCYGAFLKAMAALRLDVEPPGPIGRPGKGA
jgi:Phage terminase, small subunit